MNIDSLSDTKPSEADRRGIPFEARRRQGDTSFDRTPPILERLWDAVAGAMLAIAAIVMVTKIDRSVEGVVAAAVLAVVALCFVCSAALGMPSVVAEFYRDGWSDGKRWFDAVCGAIVLGFGYGHPDPVARVFATAFGLEALLSAARGRPSSLRLLFICVGGF